MGTQYEDPSLDNSNLRELSIDLHFTCISEKLNKQSADNIKITLSPISSHTGTEYV